MAATWAPAWASGVGEDYYDFAGMFGYGMVDGRAVSYPNPATGAMSCPSGYQSHPVFGTDNVDWPAFVCTRAHVAGRAPLYDFGGMVGLAGETYEGAVPWLGYFYFVNELTHTDACPRGYARQQVLGSPGVDNSLFYCYRPHTGAGVRVRFGGMSGNGAVRYPNPATQSFESCPQGYRRRTAYGTRNVDYTFHYCGIAQNAPLEDAGQRSLGIGEPLVANALAELPQGSLQQRLAHLDGQLLDIRTRLRPRVFRMWTVSSLVLADENTPGELMPLFRHAVQSLYDDGVTLVGMDNDFPQWMTGHAPQRIEGGWAWTVPCRSAAGEYGRFLDRYERHWATLAAQFPQIRHWEVANETNGPNLMRPPAGACALYDEQTLADITTDLMFRAHRAIKSVNPQATVYLPPPSPLGDLSLTPIDRFIRRIYGNIQSGRFGSASARDFFDGVAWHPYIFADARHENWIVPNQRIHSVLADYNDQDIPVILSEVGNSSYHACRRADQPGSGGHPVGDYLCEKREETVLGDWLANTVLLTQGTHVPPAPAPPVPVPTMPWVKYLIWFRAFDDPAALSWGGPEEAAYGVFDGAARATSASTRAFCAFTNCDRD